MMQMLASASSVPPIMMLIMLFHYLLSAICIIFQIGFPELLHTSLSMRRPGVNKAGSKLSEDAIKWCGVVLFAL